jgi:hypothetical protein
MHVANDIEVVILSILCAMEFEQFDHNDKECQVQENVLYYNTHGLCHTMRSLVQVQILVQAWLDNGVFCCD